MLIQAQNQARFGQAKVTSVTIPLLSTLLGWCGTTAAASCLLNGTLSLLDIAGLSNATVKSLRPLGNRSQT